MKKYFMIALAAMSMTMVSCKKENVEAKAKDLAEQCKAAAINQDDAKLDSLGKVWDEWTKGLKDEDKKKAEDIMKAAQEEAMQQLQQLNDAIDNASASLEALEEANAGLEEVAADLEDAAADLEDVVEE